MIDERKMVEYNSEMAEKANGAVQIFRVLIDGRYLTNMPYLLLQTKWNIDSCPIVSQEEKEAGKPYREF